MFCLPAWNLTVIELFLKDISPILASDSWNALVVIGASASQSVDLGFNLQVESYQKTLRYAIHSFHAWRSALQGWC